MCSWKLVSVTSLYSESIELLGYLFYFFISLELLTIQENAILKQHDSSQKYNTQETITAETGQSTGTEKTQEHLQVAGRSWNLTNRERMSGRLPGRCSSLACLPRSEGPVL